MTGLRTQKITAETFYRYSMTDVFNRTPFHWSAPVSGAATRLTKVTSLHPPLPVVDLLGRSNVLALRDSRIEPMPLKNRCHHLVILSAPLKGEHFTVSMLLRPTGAPQSRSYGWGRGRTPHFYTRIPSMTLPWTSVRRRLMPL